MEDIENAFEGDAGYERVKGVFPMTAPDHYSQLIDRVTDRIYAMEPDLWEKYGERGVQKSKEDLMHHIRHLETTYQLQDAKVFVDYAVWLNGILVAHGMKTHHLTDSFRVIGEELEPGKHGTPEAISAYLMYMEAAINRLEQGSETDTSDVRNQRG